MSENTAHLDTVRYPRNRLRRLRSRGFVVQSKAPSPRLPMSVSATHAMTRRLHNVACAHGACFAVIGRGRLNAATHTPGYARWESPMLLRPSCSDEHCWDAVTSMCTPTSGACSRANVIDLGCGQPPCMLARFPQMYSSNHCCRQDTGAAWVSFASSPASLNGRPSCGSHCVAPCWPPVDAASTGAPLALLLIAAPSTAAPTARSLLLPLPACAAQPPAAAWCCRPC